MHWTRTTVLALLGVMTFMSCSNNDNPESPQDTVIHKDYRVTVRMKIISNADGVNYGDTVAHPNQTIDYEGWVCPSPSPS